MLGHWDRDLQLDNITLIIYNKSEYDTWYPTPQGDLETGIRQVLLGREVNSVSSNGCNSERVSYGCFTTF